MYINGQYQFDELFAASTTELKNNKVDDHIYGAYCDNASKSYTYSINK